PLDNDAPGHIGAQSVRTGVKAMQTGREIGKIGSKRFEQNQFGNVAASAAEGILGTASASWAKRKRIGAHQVDEVLRIDSLDRRADQNACRCHDGRAQNHWERARPVGRARSPYCAASASSLAEISTLSISTRMNGSASISSARSSKALKRTGWSGSTEMVKFCGSAMKVLTAWVTMVLNSSFSTSASAMGTMNCRPALKVSPSTPCSAPTKSRTLLNSEASS